MRKLKSFLTTTRYSLYALLFCLSCALSVNAGYCQELSAVPAAVQETKTDILIPVSQWSALKQELKAREIELNELEAALKTLKRPSTELQQQLEKARRLLEESQMELANVRSELTALNRDLVELKTLSQTLKQQIEHERKVARRRVWQNRLWFLLIGAAAGAAAAR